jgi:hypothetical protein
MKKILLATIIVFVLVACEKESKHPVIYRITNSDSGFDVNYRDKNGNLQSEKVITQSAEDIWRYSYDANEGDIVFVSTIYKDINSAILIQIFIDGKIYKEGSSTGDTTKYLTVSGTVPY